MCLKRASSCFPIIRWSPWLTEWQPLFVFEFSFSTEAHIYYLNHIPSLRRSCYQSWLVCYSRATIYLCWSPWEHFLIQTACRWAEERLWYPFVPVLCYSNLDVSCAGLVPSSEVLWGTWVVFPRSTVHIGAERLLITGDCNMDGSPSHSVKSHIHIKAKKPKKNPYHVKPNKYLINTDVQGLG